MNLLVNKEVHLGLFVICTHTIFCPLDSRQPLFRVLSNFILLSLEKISPLFTCKLQSQLTAFLATFLVNGSFCARILCI